VSIINERNFDRVTGLIEDAAEKGARVLTITGPGEAALLPDRAARRIPPTLLFDVTPGMLIESEEIFGPVLVVYPYDELSEPIGHISAHPSPLAAYWFGPDDCAYREFLARTNSGGVTRDDLGLHWTIEGAPSGGIGMSGMGAYTGRAGFATFSHFRTVTASQRPAGMFAYAMPADPQAAAAAVSGMISAAAVEIAGRIARQQTA
jgi:coniferyl-aldehyde dehydrogenase